jgi:hypothetical protein
MAVTVPDWFDIVNRNAFIWLESLVSVVLPVAVLPSVNVGGAKVVADIDVDWLELFPAVSKADTA